MKVGQVVMGILLLLLIVLGAEATYWENRAVRLESAVGAKTTEVLVSDYRNGASHDHGSNTDPYDLPLKVLTFAVGFLTFLVLCFQGWVYWHMTGIMNGQLEEAKTAAAAAATQARTAEQTISILERPRLHPVLSHNFVEIMPAAHAFSDGIDARRIPTVPKVEFELVNYGRTPAVLRFINAKIVGPEGAAPSEDTSYPLIDLPKQRIIHPKEGSEQMVAGGSAFHTFITKDNYDALMGARMFWWFFGSVGFDDIWGDQNVMHFCWRYDQSLRVFEPHPRERNYTDQRAPIVRDREPPATRLRPPSRLESSNVIIVHGLPQRPLPPPETPP